ncbi:MAG: pre-peptidase C-terminal domain-containing protein, partial [Acetobacteraceae bacterium]|nr:pre-peptidase C-terminal domain-containing protein [Acetobacteraceae bacterium]
STSGSPGRDSAFTLNGSGFMEGASTITIGGVVFDDKFTNLPTLDVTGGTNGAYSVTAPLTVDGMIKVTTEGGYASIAGSTVPAASPSLFTGIQTPGLIAGVPAAGGAASANAGQTITLLGQGFTNQTLVQFDAADDAGHAGTVLRAVTASSDGTSLTVQIPELARSGKVSVLGAAASFDLQVVPTLRSVGGTLAAGKTVILEGTGLVATELKVLIDGKAVTDAVVRTIADASSYSNYYGATFLPETTNQQLVTLTVPGDVGPGLITLQTAGGSASLNSYVSTVLPGIDPGADDVGDTLDASLKVALAAGATATVNTKVGDGTFAGLDVDIYKVDLNAGDLISLNLTGSSYMHLRVFNAAGVEKASTYVYPSGTAPTDFVATTAGSYYVGISGYSNTSYDPAVAGSGNNDGYTGTYALGISRFGSGQTRLTSIDADAARGTPAHGGVASANPGQTITLNGSGLTSADAVVFLVADAEGVVTSLNVTPASIAADGNSLTVVVPDSAVTGMVRLVHDRAGLLLQVVPVLDDVSMPVDQAFTGATLSLTGRGFIEGANTVNFGATTLADPSRRDGSDATYAYIDSAYRYNGRLNLTVPNGVPAGPISVTTTGGTSNVFGLTFTGLTAAAASGAPADPLKFSANPGQTITVLGGNLDLGSEVVFQTYDVYGTRSQIVVHPTAVAADGTTADVVVPDAAVTGYVRVVGDSSGTDAYLQIVPVVTAVDVTSVQQQGLTAAVTLRGGGFIDGDGTQYLFGTTIVEDPGPGAGPDVYQGAPNYRQNDTVNLTLPLNASFTGPVMVRTAGGTSAPFTVGLTGITAVAASGTAADTSEASANPGQSITLTGTGLSTATDVLLRYRESGVGALRMVLLNPSAAADDGTTATLTVPAYANGAFTLQVLGASAQPLLQIVPVVTGFDVSGGNLYLAGNGFLEGASSYGFAGATVVDDSGSSGPDTYYASGADNSGVRIDDPMHGFGPITVTTAGGTSAAFVLNELNPALGYLRDVAFDTKAGALWLADNGNPGTVHKIDTTTGQELLSFQMNTKDFGVQHLQPGGMQVAPAAFTLGGTAVVSGSLLLFNGGPNPDRVIAVDPATGTALASLALPANFNLSSGVFDPASGHLFVVDRRSSPDRIAEINPDTGALIGGFDLPFNAGESGLAIDPVTGNLWYGSDNSNSVVEITTAGVTVRTVSLVDQGINNTEVSGLAFDASGQLLVASTQGRVYRVTLPPAP